jgi:hypothetical protein
VQAEAWLLSVALKNGTKSTIRKIMCSMFIRACRWEITDRNSIIHVRQATQRVHGRNQDYVHEDRVGKLFIMVFINGDLPTNSMCMRECMVCGEVFDRDESREHAEIPGPPSPLRPFASAGRYW